MHPVYYQQRGENGTTTPNQRVPRGEHSTFRGLRNPGQQQLFSPRMMYHQEEPRVDDERFCYRGNGHVGVAPQMIIEPQYHAAKKQQHQHRQLPRRQQQQLSANELRQMQQRLKDEFESGLMDRRAYEHVQTQLQAQMHDLLLSDQGVPDNNYTDEDNEKTLHDPNEHDQMFHKQSRTDANMERYWEKAENNRTAIDYHLFAPKFENTRDSNGHQDTRGCGVGGSGGASDNARQRDTMNNKLQDRRGVERQAFPARTAPAPAGATHPLANRKLGSAADGADRGYVSRFPSRHDVVTSFNQSIDSLHLPDDMKRPMATRDSVKRLEEAQSGFTGDTNISGKGAPKLDNGYLADRNINWATTLTPATSSTFEDMFY